MVSEEGPSTNVTADVRDDVTPEVPTLAGASSLDAMGQFQVESNLPDPIIIQ